MINEQLKDRIVNYILPRVTQPAQYIGGELNMVRKDHRTVEGKLCFAFPDTYALGMSHHGMQILYTLMNRKDDWVCERVFAPWMDMDIIGCCDPMEVANGGTTRVPIITIPGLA